MRLSELRNKGTKVKYPEKPGLQEDHGYIRDFEADATLKLGGQDSHD